MRDGSKETVRAECRERNLFCPSCEVIWADLPDSHLLLRTTRTDMIGGVAKCATGRALDIARMPAETLRLAAETAFWDAYNRGQLIPDVPAGAA